MSKRKRGTVFRFHDYLLFGLQQISKFAMLEDQIANFS